MTTKTPQQIWEGLSPTMRIVLLRIADHRRIRGSGQAQSHWALINRGLSEPGPRLTDLGRAVADYGAKLPQRIWDELSPGERLALLRQPGAKVEDYNSIRKKGLFQTLHGELPLLGRAVAEHGRKVVS